MKVPPWIKPGVVGAIVGAIVISIVGFSWWGWTTQSTAEQLASERAETAVVEVLTPLCMSRAAQNPEAFMELAEISSSFQRRNFIEDTSWAVPPGQEGSHRSLAVACAAALEDMELEEVQDMTEEEQES